jgi:predicted TIM-barrel fold metal-dependent hydrolase
MAPRCDSHVHFVGPLGRYPQVPTSTYVARPASLEELHARATPWGISRFVAVQPSFYGTDNTLANLEYSRPGAVAVIDPAAMSHEALVDHDTRGDCRNIRLLRKHVDLLLARLAHTDIPSTCRLRFKLFGLDLDRRASDRATDARCQPILDLGSDVHWTAA